MAVLTPCRQCHRRDDCEVKARTQKALRGLAITKATVKCAIPASDFPPGSVVDVRAFQIVESDRYEHEYRKEAVIRRGVVSKWRENKATVILDPGQEIEKTDGDKIAFLKLPSDRLTQSGEQRVELCPCGLSRARCDAATFPHLPKGAEWFCRERALKEAMQ